MNGGLGMNAGGAPPSPHGDLAPIQQHSRSTLWQGELEPWMDESFLRQLWGAYDEHVVPKVARNKLTGAHAGYAFVEFSSYETAQRCLQQLNGHPIPNTHSTFRLNWAGATATYGPRPSDGPEYSLFVGDLGREVNDHLLFSTFHQRYPSCKTAKVVVDPVTTNSKGYGFVRFSEESECYRAMYEMNGQYCGSRPMRISAATPRTQKFGGAGGANAAFGGASGAGAGSYDWQAPQWGAAAGSGPFQDRAGAAPGAQHMLGPHHPAAAPHAGMAGQPPALPGSADPTNAKVFVGGLAAHVTEDELRAYFSRFGEIIYVKIPAGKGCGFVHFSNKASADMAIAGLNGVPIGGSPVRLSWARTAADKQRLAQHSAMAQATAAHHHGHGHHGHALGHHHPHHHQQQHQQPQHHQHAPHFHQHHAAAAMLQHQQPPQSSVSPSSTAGVVPQPMHASGVPGTSSGSPPSSFAGVAPVATGMYYDGAFAPVELYGGAAGGANSGRASPAFATASSAPATSSAPAPNAVPPLRSGSPFSLSGSLSPRTAPSGLFSREFFGSTGSLDTAGAFGNGSDMPRRFAMGLEGTGPDAANKATALSLGIDIGLADKPAADARWPSFGASASPPSSTAAGSTLFA